MFKTLYSLSVLCIYINISRGEKFIINTDAGSDDGVAILLLLRYEASKPSSDFEIIAITCTYGNIYEKQVEINVLNTLTVASRKIPVYAGATKGFINKYHTDNYFGDDGFGNSNFTNLNTSVQVDKSKHAAVALIDLVKEHSGNVSIISLGPTTNIALAIALDNSFMSHVNKIYQVGGSVRGIGNANPNVEFNFGADPESNFILFNSSLRKQIFLYSNEYILDNVVTKNWRKNVLGQLKSPDVDFINQIEKFSLNNKRGANWIAGDALAVATIIDPKIIISQQTVNVHPVKDGEARGSVLVDYMYHTGRTNNTNIIMKINITMYKKMLLHYFSCKEISC